PAARFCSAKCSKRRTSGDAKSSILWEPFLFHFLGSSELTLRRDFAPQNARNAGLPAIFCFPQRLVRQKREPFFRLS
ncbi:MAG: hypothetical protein Q4G01_04880, partial [Eubacteriales bacterium]|nr:hypothetical protein [Eubacteriales bacterium]